MKTLSHHELKTFASVISTSLWHQCLSTRALEQFSMKAFFLGQCWSQRSCCMAFSFSSCIVAMSWCCVTTFRSQKNERMKQQGHFCLELHLNIVVSFSLFDLPFEGFKNDDCSAHWLSKLSLCASVLHCHQTEVDWVTAFTSAPARNQRNSVVHNWQLDHLFFSNLMWLWWVQVSFLQSSFCLEWPPFLFFLSCTSDD